MNSEVPPFHKKVIREKEMRVDRRNHVTMLIPGIFYMETMFTPAGQGAEKGNLQNAREYRNCQYMTPETERTTHFFWAYLNNFEGDDSTISRSLLDSLIEGFMQLDKVMGYVADARARGAKVVLGGERREEPGYFYPLTVIAEATDEMRVVSEEQFGPVIPIIKYRSVEEAMRRANSLEVGLGGSVWGNDPQEAARYARQLECGTAWVNQHGALHPLAPFGGVKSSGLGVEFNVDGLKEYTTIQVVNVAR